MTDPYVYPGTDVLKNKEDIRDQAALDQFERLMTFNRIAEGLPKVALTSAGYRQLHHHIFQDVYDWAGQVRTVDIARPGSMFCLAPYVAAELEKRFNKISAEDGLCNLSPGDFAARAAEHITELNAIHAFRDGNGRTQRAFLEVLGDHASHPIAIERIHPQPWNEASRDSFHSGEIIGMRIVIAEALRDEHQRELATKAARLAQIDQQSEGLSQTRGGRVPGQTPTRALSL